MIGFYDEYEKLYDIYIKELSQFDVKNVLDIGCGNGAMLVHLSKLYSAKGIDISPCMIKKACEKGVEATCKSIDEVDEKFDTILAVSDVLNYLDISTLENFLKDVERLLEEGGIFVCDINTLYAFEEITVGSMSVDRDEEFLSIESDFNDDVLVTLITLFEKEGEVYTKEQAEILQYYYAVSQIKSLTNLKLLDSKEVALFSDKPDKNILIFQKTLSI